MVSEGHESELDIPEPVRSRSCPQGDQGLLERYMVGTKVSAIHGHWRRLSDLN